MTNRVQEQAKRPIVSTTTRSTASAPVQTKSSKPNSVYEARTTQTSTTSRTEGYSVERTSTANRAISDKESQLLQRFNNTYPKFNFSQKTKIEFMERISGMSLKELANDAKSIELVFDAISNALDELKGQKLTNTNLAEQANKYFIVVKYGRYNSISQYRSNKHFESLDQKLKRTGLKTATEYMRSQFGKDRSFDGGVRDYIKAKQSGLTVKEFKRKQSMQDFAKMLVNSSKDDKFRLADAICELHQSNNIEDNDRVTALKMIYASLSPAERIEFSERFVNDKELLRIVGADANKATIQGSAHVVGSNMSQEQAVRHNNNINKSVTEIENRIAALRAKKNLTPNEQQELQALENQLNNQYTPMMTGNTTGTLANRNIQDISVVNNILANNTSHTNREEVIVGVAEYVTNHSGEMAYSYEECTALMDQATNGEYSQTLAQLGIETTSAEENTVSSSFHAQPSDEDDLSEFGQYNYIERPVAYEATDGNDSEATMYGTGAGTGSSHNAYNNHVSASGNNGLQQDSGSQAPAINTNSNEIDSLIREELIERPKSIIKSIIEGFKNIGKGSTERQKAKIEYKRSSSDVQLAVLRSIGTSDFDELIPLTTEATIIKFFNGGNKGPNNNSTKKLKEHLEEIRKQERKNHTSGQNIMVA